MLHKMKFIILLALSCVMVYCDGLDYWKTIKQDPLNWVDRVLPREIIGDDQSVYIPKWNKEDPHFKENDRNWKVKNFKRTNNQNLGRAWKQGDAPDLFFNGQSFISDISKLPTSGQTASEPWSSTYWPIKNGILSVRYADNEKNTITDDNGNSLVWKDSVGKYSEPRDNQAALATGEDNYHNYINTYFSPAEKYDLLVGDTQAFTLTNNNKHQGTHYEDSNGDVESWMGICHGWAPAAFSLPRPQNDVELLAADGKTKVKFYADDIRGLAHMRIYSLVVDAISKLLKSQKTLHQVLSLIILVLMLIQVLGLSS